MGVWSITWEVRYHANLTSKTSILPPGRWSPPIQARKASSYTPASNALSSTALSFPTFLTFALRGFTSSRSLITSDHDCSCLSHHRPKRHQGSSSINYRRQCMPQLSLCIGIPNPSRATFLWHLSEINWPGDSRISVLFLCRVCVTWYLGHLLNWRSGRSEYDAKCNLMERKFKWRVWSKVWIHQGLLSMTPSRDITIVRSSALRLLWLPPMMISVLRILPFDLI